MGKGSKGRYQKQQQQKQTLAMKKEEEEVEAAYHDKGGNSAPMASRPTPTRCSRRLLGARHVQSSLKDYSSSDTHDFPTTKSVNNDAYAQVDTQTPNSPRAASIPQNESFSPSLTYAQDLPTTKEVAKDTPILTKVPSPPREEFLSYSRANNSTRVNATTTPSRVAKRGNFIKEKITNNFEKSDENSQPCPTEQNQEEPHSVMALTEIADIAGKYIHEDSEDEVVSSYNLSHCTVNGYAIKKEFASLVRNIFDKYGDIVINSFLKSHKAHVFFLEMVCVIISNH